MKSGLEEVQILAVMETTNDSKLHMKYLQDEPISREETLSSCTDEKRDKKEKKETNIMKKNM